MDEIAEDEIETFPTKYLLEDIPQEFNVTENHVKMALKQKKCSPRWVMLKFLDPSTALVAMRAPKKFKNSNFTIYIRGKVVKVVRLTPVQQAEFELMLSSETADMFYSAANLRSTVESIVKEMSLVENEDLFEGRKGDIKYDLIAATRKHYQVYAFGSRVMGLGFKNSDYDVFIDMENYYKGGGETKKENSVQRIRDLLQSTRAFSDFILIPRARVPILKVKHCSTKVHCDISTTSGIGVENTKLLRNYLSDQRVRFVAAAVKLWSKQVGLTQAAMGPGAITSYCMLWLVLFSLMQDNPPAVVPVLSMKQAHKGKKLFIEGWDCSFCGSIPPKTTNNKNEIEMLHHFFNYYASMTNHAMTNNVLCPYNGTMIPIKQFKKTNALPDEFDNYKKQVGVHRYNEMSCDSVMCVQDPIDQGHNIAKAVDNWVLDRFLRLCRTSGQMMENNMKEELGYKSVETNK